MKKKSKVKKVSPYRELQDWFFNSNPNAILSESTLKGINPRAVLGSMSKLSGITVFLNEHFNNYELMKMKPIEFYKFIRSLIKKYNVGRYDFSFFKSEKQDKSLSEIHQYFPQLKRYELHNLLTLAEDDPDFEALMDSIGLKKYKKKKTTAKDKKLIKKIGVKKSVESNLYTFKKWRDNFA